jgi:hypothetical protein
MASWKISRKWRRVCLRPAVVIVATEEALVATYASRRQLQQAMIDQVREAVGAEPAA